MTVGEAVALDVVAASLIVLVCLLAGLRLARRFRLPLSANVLLFLVASAYLFGFSLYRASSFIREMVGEAALALTWTSILVGLGGVVLGYTRGMNSAQPAWVKWSSATLRTNRAGLVGVSLTLLGILGEWMFIRISGGAAVYFSQGRGAGAYGETTAYLYAMRWLLLPGLAFLILAGQRGRSWRSVAVAVLLVYLAYNVWLGQRTGWATGVFLAMGAYAAWRRRKPRASVVLAGLAVVLVGIAALRAVRGDVYLGSSFDSVQQIAEEPLAFVGKAVTGGVAEPMSGGFAEDAEIVLFARFVSAVPDRVAYDYFVYYLDYAVSWVPRILWPDRPSFSRKKIEELTAVLGTSHRSGPTPTIFGMYYLHMGLAGVLILSVFTGWYLSVLDRSLLAIPQGTGTGLLGLAMPAAGLSMPMGLGPLADIPTILPFVLLPVCLGWLFCRRPSAASDNRTEWVVERNRMHAGACRIARVA